MSLNWEFPYTKCITNALATLLTHALQRLSFARDSSETKAPIVAVSSRYLLSETWWPNYQCWVKTYIIFSTVVLR